jgi:hypothetical protein
VIDVALQKDKTLPSCIGAWGNIGAKIATTYLCVGGAPPPPHASWFFQWPNE